VNFYLFTYPKLVSTRLLRIFLTMIVIMSANNIKAQSCCSGGVPISNSLGLPLSGKGSFQLSLGYDLNVLNTLMGEDVKLDDRSRRRLTHSVLTQVGYVLSSRFSVELFLSYIQQRRIIRQFGNIDRTIAEGPGDAVLLLKYRVVPGANGFNWAVGLGPKVPAGPSDRRDENDIALNADLQPGSGAWDLVTWTQLSRAFAARPSLTWSLTGSYVAKGTNPDYLGSQVYQFGNELVVMAGLADRFLVNRFLWGGAIQTIFRHASQDKNNGEETPGTGGRWVFLRPSISIYPLKNTTFTAGASFPLYSWLRDTQLTPTVRYNASLYVEIPERPPAFIQH